jgi:hypothetical protein
VPLKAACPRAAVAVRLQPPTGTTPPRAHPSYDILITQTQRPQRPTTTVLPFEPQPAPGASSQSRASPLTHTRRHQNFSQPPTATRAVASPSCSLLRSNGEHTVRKLRGAFFSPFPARAAQCIYTCIYTAGVRLPRCRHPFEQLLTTRNRLSAGTRHYRSAMYVGTIAVGLLLLSCLPWMLTVSLGSVHNPQPVGSLGRMRAEGHLAERRPAARQSWFVGPPSDGEAFTKTNWICRFNSACRHLHHRHDIPVPAVG